MVNRIDLQKGHDLHESCPFMLWSIREHYFTSILSEAVASLAISLRM